MKGLKGLLVLTLLVLTTLVVNARIVDGEVGYNKVADLDIQTDSIHFMPKMGYEEIVLTISIPDGRVESFKYQSWDTPKIDLTEERFMNLPDGQYTYQLTVLNKAKLNNRDSESAKLFVDQKPAVDNGKLSQTGYFIIKDGVFLGSDDLEETAPENNQTTAKGGTTGGDTPVTEGQVFVTDVIVQGSECVGFDCSSSENFGFDTFRLKENNLRINFNDTSSSGSFPTRDWRIVANDTTNGGGNYFAVEDSDTSRRVFTIEAGAPANSLYVEDYGRVGLGTSTPVVELHIADGDTPTVRLDQNGSYGWTPQAWDIAGNETNFFIRDATNGSKLPFRIQPGAPSSALTIKSDGKVGIGTWSPDYSFEVETTGQNAVVAATRTDGASIFFNARTDRAAIGTVTNHEVWFVVNGNYALKLLTDNSLVMGNGATCTTAGVWTNNSSRELKENIEELSYSEAEKTLEELTPVKYNYKVDKAEKYVGFIAEDVPENVAMNDRKHMVTMDVVGVLTKVTQQQQEQLKKQQKTIDDLTKRLEELEKNKK